MIDPNSANMYPSGIQSITSEEATGKACPFSDINPCVGDRCMAWRKDYSFIKITVSNNYNNPQPPASPAKIVNNKGYCGMVTHKGN